MGVIFMTMILFHCDRGEWNNTNLQDKILRAPEIQKNNTSYIWNFHAVEGIQHAVCTRGMLQYKKQEFWYALHFVCLHNFHTTLRI